MLDPTKPLQTRDGRKVSLITTEGRGDYPLVGYVGEEDTPTSWTKEGEWRKRGGNFPIDLINIPEDVYVWINVYKDKAGKLNRGGVHGSRKSADAMQDDGRISRIRVKLVEGQWDE